MLIGHHIFYLTGTVGYGSEIFEGVPSVNIFYAAE